MARLGDIGQIITGNTPKTADVENYASKDIAFIKPSDIQEDKLTMLSGAEFYISEYARERARILSPGCILVTCIGIVGKVAINNIECAFNQQINAIVPDTKRCDTKYIAHAIQSQQHRLQKIANAAVVPILNKTQFSDIEIPLPPLEEQRRIAALLDKVSDLIAKRRAQLDKLDLLVKARFVEMFGDLAAPECPHKKCKLVETCVSSDDIKCGPFGTQLSKEEYQDHGVAVWEIPQINSYFTTQPTHFLTAEKAEQLKAYSIIPGDIAMSRKGNVGRCALFPDNFDSGIIHSDVLRIRVDKQQVNPCFMMYQLHFSGAVQRQIEVVSSGAIMAGVNVTKLKHIEIHLPDFDLQQQFAHFVGEVDRVKYSINNSLEKLETLKKALMQQYFGGGGNVENC